MKRLKVFSLVTSYILVTALVVVAVFVLSNRYLVSQDATAESKQATCQKHGISHAVIIQGNKATPQHISASLCDTLTIINAGNEPRLMAFGLHENHQPYDGITERILNKGQSLTVTLNQAGTYQFHDHIGDIVKGDFTVMN